MMPERTAPEVSAVGSPWLTDAGRELRDRIRGAPVRGRDQPAAEDDRAQLAATSAPCVPRAPRRAADDRAWRTPGPRSTWSISNAAPHARSRRRRAEAPRPRSATRRHPCAVMNASAMPKDEERELR